MKKNSKIDNIVSEEIKKFIIKESKKDIVDKIIKESVEDAVNNAIEEAGYNSTMKKGQRNFACGTLRGAINRKLFPKKYKKFLDTEFKGNEIASNASNSLTFNASNHSYPDNEKEMRDFDNWKKSVEKYGTRYVPWRYKD